MMASDKPVQVLLVHSNPAMALRLSKELASATGIQVLGVALSHRHGKRLIETHDFDVLLVDLLLKDGNALDLITYAKKVRPLCEVVVAGREGGQDAVHVFALGATGYVSCTGALGRHARAVQQVASGGAYITPSVSRKVFDWLEHQSEPLIRHPDLDRLTPRELQVLKMVADGHTSLPLAKKLGISSWTVNVHVANILRKMNVRTRAQAISKAYERGVL